jgi:hypothetical protein
MYERGTIGFYVAIRQPQTFELLLTKYCQYKIRKIIEREPEEPNREIERMMRTNNRYDHTKMM